MASKKNNKSQTIEFEAYIKRDINNIPQFYVRGWGEALELMAEELLGSNNKIELKMAVTVTDDGKGITERMRGYLFGGLGPLVRMKLNNDGYAPKDTYEALKIISMDPQIDFMEDVYDEDGNFKGRRPLSLADDADVPRKKIREFIDRLFLLLSEEGYHPTTPEEYKKGLRWRRAVK